MLKIHSPDITHKTDVGGVALNLGSDEAVRKAYRADDARRPPSAAPTPRSGASPSSRWSRHPNAFELIIGSKKDPIFGSVIMVGMGGVAAEVFRDRALALPPLNESLARRMLESLKSWPLLKGYRGKPGANIERLLEILMRFSYLVADYPEIKEFDVNPLLVTAEDVVALDARVVVDRDLVVHSPRPYAHLAIRPYPEEFVTAADAQGRRGGDAAADQAGRRADVARPVGELLDGVDPLPVQLSLQADHARDGRPATASSTTTARSASSPKSRKKASAS